MINWITLRVIDWVALYGALYVRRLSNPCRLDAHNRVVFQELFYEFYPAGMPGKLQIIVEIAKLILIISRKIDRCSIAMVFVCSGFISDNDWVVYFRKFPNELFYCLNMAFD